MFVPPHFAVSDLAAIHAFMRTNVFAVIAGQIGGAIQFAYAPIVLDPDAGPSGSVRFHLARANPLAGIEDGAELKLSIMAVHAYISPDWYSTPGQVPTWNYVAVEGGGRVRRLAADGLKLLLADLAAQEEGALAPKRAWTMERVPPERLEFLLKAIAGFELPLERLEGKAKLSQNRARADREGAIAALELRGDAASAAIAAAMRDSLNEGS
jgi:transcriptional regulator